MFVLYEALLYLFAAVMLPWYLIVGLARGKYLGSFRERLGRYRTPAEPHELWLHAVSVGEVGAARAVLDRVRALRPQLRVVFTTTTATGQAAARRLAGDAVSVTYFPFDFSFSVKRFLDHYRPRVFASVETEIWPNTIRLARQRGARLLLLNARLSDESFPRYRAARFVLRRVLSGYSAILARSEEDRQRFLALGAVSGTVEIAGNVKFDYEPDPTPLEVEPQIREWLGSRKLLVAGSTMDGEEAMLLSVLSRLVAAGVAVILAPRKTERFSTVASLLQSEKVAFFRRTELASAALRGDILLLDSLGELARLYRLADVAFVGGSLVPAGGHNPIEPAAVGTPVAFGPYMSNFRDVASVFLRDGGAWEVKSAEELADFVLSITSDPEARQKMSRRGLEIVRQNRGAAARNAQRIVDLLG